MSLPVIRAGLVSRLVVQRLIALTDLQDLDKNDSCWREASGSIPADFAISDRYDVPKSAVLCHVERCCHRTNRIEEIQLTSALES